MLPLYSEFEVDTGELNKVKVVTYKLNQVVIKSCNRSFLYI